MKNEIHIFFTALMFYTRIPSPRWVRYSEGYLKQSIRYLPLVGCIVGGASALALVLGLCVFPAFIAVLISMLAGVLLTGAFHEDGLADVCDGFGGGWTKGKILEIMKDSRVGTYGAAALFFVLLLKLAALVAVVDLPPPTHLSVEVFLALVWVSGHGLSRFIALTALISHNYVREDELVKAKPALKKSLRWWDGSILCAMFFGVGPLFFFQTPWLIVPLLLMFLTKWWMCRFFNKWIGGYTGDCLGSIQQVSEVVYYLGIIGIWKFI